MRVLNLSLKLLSTLLIATVFSFSVTAAPGPEFHEGPSETEFTIRSLEVAEFTDVGDKIVGTVLIENTGTGGGTGLIEVRVGIQLMKLADIVLQPGEASPYTFRFMMSDKGVYELTVRTPNDSRTAEFNYGLEEELTEETPLNPTPADIPSTVSLSSFDTDGDCIISDAEFFDVIDRWVTRLIDETLFFTGVDAWIGQASVCAASAEIEIVELKLAVAQMTNRGAMFVAQSATVSNISVEVFGLAGEFIYTGSSNNNALRWNLRSSDGQPVANGVYLYRVTTTDSNGQILMSDIQKFIVIR